MQNTPPQVTIPRHEQESSRAYQARVEYVTAGPQRSIDKLAQNHTKTIPHYKAWSSKYEWVESARQYDETMAHLAIHAAGEAYRADLESHRRAAQQYGQALCGVAIAMLTQLQAEARSIEYTPAALATIARALTTGLDLQAHALQIAQLLPKLETDRDSE